MQELIGKPMLWRTATYGDIAVHVTKLSPNEMVANLTIDGGLGATPCQRFPELSDGIGFATIAQLVKRPSRSRKAVPVDPVPLSVQAKRVRKAPAKLARTVPSERKAPVVLTLSKDVQAAISEVQF